MALPQNTSVDERQQPNVCTLSQNFTDCALALKSCAATPATVQWIFQNTGVAWAFCGHLTELRECGVEESVIEMILANVFPKSE